MAHINVQGLVNNISEKTTVYTTIVEAIVNSIEAIEEEKEVNGVITITVKREDQIPLDLAEDSLPRIVDITVQDNGIGFNNNNRESFDTLYSDQKIELGGKGFGRFIFLKYFEKVEVDSIYQEDGKIYRRTFTFSGNDRSAENLVENDKVLGTNQTELKTVVSLLNIKETYLNKLDKKLETIARQLVEKLLPYFINDKYKCPKIILKEFDGSKEITLNNYFDEHEGIKKVSDREFILKKDGSNDEEKFDVKIFKIYYTQSPSAVILTAHNRAVTTESLYEYVPEFKDDFFDIVETKDEKTNHNYSIKVYVLGKYLNKNVSLERDDFEFPKYSDLLYPFSRNEIEAEATKIVADEFKDEVISRKEKKHARIKEYVDQEAPWHKAYFQELDVSSIPYNFDEITVEAELQKLKFKKEQSVKEKVTNILKIEEGEEDELTRKISEISKELTEFGKSDLAHYIVLRKAIIDLLNKSLKWNKDKQFEKEKVIHELIFPMKDDSDHLPYDKHNLWIIDERLSFQDYIASDKPLNESDERPDLLIFSKAIAIRDGDELSNPITVFEFKRPQREGYDDKEDPIVQLFDYIAKIRKGQFKNIEGRYIKANENTPAYGFLICDLTEKIEVFCKRHDLTPSPDKQGYYGYSTGYNIYIEVISFDKLINDAEQRNKIFFKKLNIT